MRIRALTVDICILDCSQWKIINLKHFLSEEQEKLNCISNSEKAEDKNWWKNQRLRNLLSWPERLTINLINLWKLHLIVN